MKNKYTIIEAAKKVLSVTNSFMSVTEIYTQILEHSLYVFHAQDPISVLRGELRSHSIGIDFPTASSKKYFLYDEMKSKLLKRVERSKYHCELYEKCTRNMLKFFG